MYRSAFARLGA